MHCKMFTSMLSFYPLDADSTKLGQSKCFNVLIFLMFPVGQDYPWWRTTAVMLISYTTMVHLQKLKINTEALLQIR